MSSPQRPDPAPIVVSSSQEWGGIDGNWSTFKIRVGTPEQDFQVLPSFFTSTAMIPVSDGCDNVIDGTSSCNVASRSPGFQVNESSTWHEIGLYGVDLRTEINYTVDGLYGLDHVGLGEQNDGGPTLSDQLVALYADVNFRTGFLGMSPKMTNLSGFDNLQKSYITALKDEGTIPSASFGYTAGAWYGPNDPRGSLTLGGYDQSRFMPSNITFPFDPDGNHPLTLSLHNITAQTLNQSKSLLNYDIYVQIDTTVPHLWLPIGTCDLFEEVFQLTYDDNTDLYVVNSSVHRTLMQQNPNVTFTFEASADSSKQVDIVLPYRAFNLQTAMPIYENKTNYFPIRRGATELPFILGRAFFQEAYIVVDHERMNFSINQAIFPTTNTEQQIVSIQGLAYRNQSMPTSNPSGKQLSKGGIAGVAIGSAAFVILCVILLIDTKKRRKNAVTKIVEDGEVGQPGTHDREPIEMPEPGIEADGTQKVELEGNSPAELLVDGSSKRLP